MHGMRRVARGAVPRRPAPRRSPIDGLCYEADPSGERYDDHGAKPNLEDDGRPRPPRGRLRVSRFPFPAANRLPMALLDARAGRATAGTRRLFRGAGQCRTPPSAS